MYEQVEKPRENKNRAVANSISQKQNGGKSTCQFVDNRPEAIAQRKPQEMENLSGMSLDDVKVHRNSGKSAQLHAHAYAQGSDIHLASGQEKYLPHEAWHVVQQKQGRVKPAMQLKSTLSFTKDNKKPNSLYGHKLIQPKWDYDALLAHEEHGNILGPAIDVFTSGVKFTKGTGLDLYRLALKHPDKLLIQFVPVSHDKGSGGDTKLTFMDGTSVIALHIDSNNVIMNPALIHEAKTNGLKIVINVNVKSKMNESTGGAINTLVHEFAVHAVEYYKIIKALLEPLDDVQTTTAVDEFAHQEGVGEPPVKKEIMNAITGKDEIETQKARGEHQQLGKGGTAYYQDLVKNIGDTQLNTWFHQKWTKNRTDFKTAQTEDVKGHLKSYDPVAFRKYMAETFTTGETEETLAKMAGDLKGAKFYSSRKSGSGEE